MDGNPATFEQLVSYAGATAKGPYPATMKVPSNMARRWTYTDTFLARCIIFYYSMTSVPEEHHIYEFKNSSYADIVPVGDVYGDSKFGFKELADPNEWDRVDAYTLRRIILPNGTAHPEFWPKFVSWYTDLQPDGRMLVYSTSDLCMRRCQYFFTCTICGWIC
eukprot:TRINITY_DN92415_c0_g1_i1.p2 TRINITY_DN92415_c0_g1~~TRINITY_DN92415_c0_g1_i1.p2  ORF type:complete len:163 (-),score=14.52 TRINITY_DN92415_c0_g1_i1:419-907(-)